MIKTSEHRFTARHLSTVLTVLYVLCLIPLFVIAWYDFPSADDFSMGLETHLAFEATGSVPAALAVCVQETISLYLTWTGYFTSSLFTVISPATFGVEWYWLGPILVFTALHAAVIVFLYVVLQKLLHMDRYLRRCATIAVLFLMIQMMPQGSARVECFYWYSGAGNYTLTFSLMLLYLSCLLLAVYAQTPGHRRLFLILACVSGFFSGGGNYMSALTGAIMTFLLAVVLVLIRSGRMRVWLAAEQRSCTQPLNTAKHDSPAGSGTAGAAVSPACTGREMAALPSAGIRADETHAEGDSGGKQHLFLRGAWRWSLFIPMGLLFTGFLLNCLAPGNSVRGEQTSGFGAVKSILISLYYTLDYCMDDWTNWAVLLILAILAVVFWLSLPGSGAVFTFRHPVVITLLGYGIVSANVTPALFAAGNISSGRIQGLFWMQFILTAALVEWYLIGWLQRKLTGLSPAPGQEENPRFSAGTIRILAFLFMLLFFGSALCVGVDAHYYAFTSSVSDLTDGTAAAYAEENRARLDILDDPEVEDAVLKRYESQPALLLFSDIDPDPENWANVKMSEYFGKNSIRGE